MLFLTKLCFGFAHRLTVKMLCSVFNRMFLFQTRPQRMGRARMKCCGGVMVTKRWESNILKLLPTISFQELCYEWVTCALYITKMCYMNKWVAGTRIWRDKQFRLVSWQKILEEQRRLKREQEEADTASRRHTGIVPTRHQFITNERFGDLLNITDNTEKRKSGIEVQHRIPSYPSVSRKSSRCFVSQFSAGLMGWSAGFLQTQTTVANI